MDLFLQFGYIATTAASLYLRPRGWEFILGGGIILVVVNKDRLCNLSNAKRISMFSFLTLMLPSYGFYYTFCSQSGTLLACRIILDPGVGSVFWR